VDNHAYQLLDEAENPEGTGYKTFSYTKSPNI